ncbi:hypothetical protein BM525_19600 (plasmid) [Alteromonas mediterranea]|uniref:Uncharacterized protein n=1 Tax=Alteromonas mediterranea TaxID=314275 RepID=A0AAC9NTR3_9ALTE|nr:hypothetical protein [Alteromonas mediterranea]APD92089.1 hypothetical protein BM524_19405 [Alteromonas mediterranea]APD99943.1 hypothetical protein BM525_19600 [Alteromonas mediterranea]
MEHFIKPETTYSVLSVQIAVKHGEDSAIEAGINELIGPELGEGWIVDYSLSGSVQLVSSSQSPQQGELFKGTAAATGTNFADIIKTRENADIQFKEQDAFSVFSAAISEADFRLIKQVAGAFSKASDANTLLFDIDMPPQGMPASALIELGGRLLIETALKDHSATHLQLTIAEGDMVAL